jgi:hypothetical protein
VGTERERRIKHLLFSDIYIVPGIYIRINVAVINSNNEDMHGTLLVVSQLLWYLGTLTNFSNCADTNFNNFADTHGLLRHESRTPDRETLLLMH